MAPKRAVLVRLAVAIALTATAAGSWPASSAAPHDTAWSAAAKAAWQQFGDPSVAPPIPTPANRVSGWAPRSAGTRATLNLDFGPYVVTAGSDVSRLDVTPAGATGYVTGIRTFVLDVDGTNVPGDEVHTHHVHLLQADPTNPDYFDWLYGTGEEMTGGSIAARAKAVPAYKHGLRYGIPMTKGSQLGALSMLHNMTSRTRTVYIRFRINFVYGSHDEIQQAKRLDYHALTPQIFGGTFNVPRTGGLYAWPRQLRQVAPTANNRGTMTSNPTPSRFEPGVGVVWTAPYSGTIVVAAGHLHAGGTDAVLSNLGSRSNPCPERGISGYPGTTLLDSRVIPHHGITPTNDYQMGASQNRWRAYVHKGDRLAINGSYFAKRYAFPDAMVFAGVYIDRSALPPAGAGCAPFLVGHRHLPMHRVIRTVPNHAWSTYPDQPTCGPCDSKETRPAPGIATDVVHIAGMQYLPGNAGTSGSPAGPPVVTRGQNLTFVNEDYAESLMRHTVTTCRAPCDGPDATNYPFFDGRIDSGVLGWMFEDAYVTTSPTPSWTLHTQRLHPGYYTMFCRIHPFMRGSFYVAPKSAHTRSQVLAWWRRLPQTG
jgi:plastocyanin